MISLGIDQIDNIVHIFKNKKVGMLTNQTGVNKNLESSVDILFSKVNLVALFAPEHGIRGDIQAGEIVETYIDESTNLKVYTLYGKTKHPTQQMFDLIDILVIDIQDIGSRFYTYISTMAYCMQSATRFNKEVVIFDRPNPMGGNLVEGNIIKEGFASFIGVYPIPQRHGLTIGELALLFNNKFKINCKLNIIKMKNWKRSMIFQDTGLQWVMPSPNMPTIETVFAYNATCIFEGTNISEGRGTTKPFEYIGAPWIDGKIFSKKMNNKNLKGVYFRPIYFTPTFSKHQGQLCEGVQVHILDFKEVRPIEISLHLLYEIKNFSEGKFEFLKPYKEGLKPMIDYNTGDNLIRTTDFKPQQILEMWNEEVRAFCNYNKKHYTYE
ncbi:MAG: hypothetical protein ATN36_00095 [Epulopiscium sp. Nele67-Bin005]|nr:MAG: hypothetical protein ATN36_00095 [Epulopiscium sp. Nele67-Bin005]